MKKISFSIKIMLGIIVLLMAVIVYLSIQWKEEKEKIEAFIPEARQLMEENEQLRNRIREQQNLLEQYENLTLPNKAQVETGIPLPTDSLPAMPEDLNFRDLNKGK